MASVLILGVFAGVGTQVSTCVARTFLLPGQPALANGFAPNRYSSHDLQSDGSSSSSS
eukprot:CAMPEP_0172754504 /NCGR_PEP_ID=MMETSP1074-20121228/158030_1 /TAXON_ID=2916 /ORGANISM="Ceratium fusus, Strain PA161109" /LENGTH=57 /DNA_ID=CAMNT_0013587409 /DNA_START=98 /DNA_END=268 /DNA_ORIENTATION=-